MTTNPYLDARMQEFPSVYDQQIISDTSVPPGFEDNNPISTIRPVLNPVETAIPPPLPPMPYPEEFRYARPPNTTAPWMGRDDGTFMQNPYHNYGQPNPAPYGQSNPAPIDNDPVSPTMPMPDPIETDPTIAPPNPNTGAQQQWQYPYYGGKGGGYYQQPQQQPSALQTALGAGVPQYGGGMYRGNYGKGGGNAYAQPPAAPDWQNRFQQVMGQSWPQQQQPAQQGKGGGYPMPQQQMQNTGKGGAPSQPPQQQSSGKGGGSTYGSNNSWS
jgi:hypothetical protein